jgi:hypothetical protein
VLSLEASTDTVEPWAIPLNISVVHGLIHGQLVSLLSSREIHRNDASIPGFSQSTFLVQYVLYGAHTQSLDAQTYDVATLEFDCLADWIAGALDTDRISELSGLRETSATAALDDGSTVRLQYVRSGSASRDVLNHARKPILTVTPPNIFTLSDLFRNYVTPLRNMLTTATGRPCMVTAVGLRSGMLTHSGYPQIVDVFHPGMSAASPMKHPNTVLARSITWTLPRSSLPGSPLMSVAR